MAKGLCCSLQYQTRLGTCHKTNGTCFLLLYLGFFVFSLAKNYLNIFRFFAKIRCKKVRKKIWLKNTTFGRQFTYILEEWPEVWPLPQSVSLKNAPYFKSHNLLLHFYVCSKNKEKSSKGHFLPNYGIKYFSHFRKKMYFYFVFREKIKMRKNAKLYILYFSVFVIWNSFQVFSHTSKAF